MPAVKLLIEGCPKPSHQVSRFAPPLVRLGASGIELLDQLLRLLLDRSRSPEDEDEAVGHEDRAKQTHEQDPRFGPHVTKGRSFPEVDPDVNCGEEGDTQKGKQNPGEDSALGGKGGAGRRRHPPHVAHPPTNNLKSLAYHI